MEQKTENQNTQTAAPAPQASTNPAPATPPPAAQANTAAPQPAQAAPQDTKPTENQGAPKKSGGGKKITIILIILVIVMAAVIGLLYMFVIKFNTTKPQPPTAQNVVTPTDTPMPTPTLAPSQELNSLDLGNPQQDLDSVNQDLQQL